MSERSRRDHPVDDVRPSRTSTAARLPKHTIVRYDSGIIERDAVAERLTESAVPSEPRREPGQLGGRVKPLTSSDQLSELTASP